MTKEELLGELALRISTGEISQQELMSRFGVAQRAQPVEENDTKGATHFSVTKMLYVLGAAVVLIGIVIFVGQIWEDIGSSGRILVTLGLGILLAIMGSVLLKTKTEYNIGSIFHFLAGMLIPGGAMVTLYEMHTDINSLWPVTITFAAIFLLYLLLNFVHRNAVLTFFAIANGTVFVYLLVYSMLGDALYESMSFYYDVYAYLTMVVGMSYLLMAYTFRGGWNKQLIGLLYSLGSFGFFGAAFSRVFDSEIWQMAFFLIVIGGLFFSVYLRSRIVLATSTIFLIVHVSYITSKYFADSLGWSISLVALGFIFIGLGYVSININKRYIKQ